MRIIVSVGRMTSIARGFAVVLFVSLGGPIQAFAQASFASHVISAESGGPTAVYAIDVDGDGDMDVLSAWPRANKVVWHENNGDGIFVDRTITTSAIDVRSVFGIDVDGDGDTDVLSASYGDARIAWYENDGNENFSPHVITTKADRARSVFAIDLDRDGDVDVLSANKDEASWYVNDGRQGFTFRIAAPWVYNIASVRALDVDGDHDIDIVTAAISPGRFRWHENNGSEVFSEHQIGPPADSAVSIEGLDLDADGDIDLVTAASLGDLAWHENNGTGTFQTHVLIADCGDHSPCSPRHVQGADMDGDQDLDILTAVPGGIRIFVNDGHTGFTPSTVTEAYSGGIFPADLDGDGDQDVLSAEEFANRLMWYENPQIANTAARESPTLPAGVGILAIYPNPFRDETTIEFDLAGFESVTATIHDLHGRTVATLVDARLSPGHQKVMFKSGDLPAGWYFCRVRMGGTWAVRHLVMVR